MNIALISGWGLAASVWPLTAWQAQGHQVKVFDLTTDPAQFALVAQQYDFDYVIGWSLGGVRALEWALAGRARVIVLASLPIMVQRADFPGGIARLAFEAFEQGLLQDGAAAMQQFVRLLALGGAQPLALQKQLRPHVLSIPTDVRALCTVDARAAWSVLQKQQRLQAVFARQDALLAAESVQQALAQLPNVPVQWVQGGHAECVINPQSWMPG